MSEDVRQPRSPDLTSASTHGGIRAQLPGIDLAFRSLLDMLPELSRGSAEKPAEFPVAASVVHLVNGELEIISTSGNRTNGLVDSTAHAELEVLKEAQREVGNKHLGEAWLLSTCEPCVMCSGAAVNVALKGVVFGARHSGLKGKSARVGDAYKPWRVTPEKIDTYSYLTASGLQVIGGFMLEDVILALSKADGYRSSDS